MKSLVATLLVVTAVPAFHASATPLPASVRAEMITAKEWHAGCPVPFSGLRVLTLSYWGFDGKRHTGQLIVNAKVVTSVTSAFKQLYRMRFPIRHMALSDEYGPVSGRPADGDITASTECRQAVPSPCSKGTGTGSWSMHAYGEAIDINPVENPYVGCGQTRDKTAVSFMKRTPLRRGMVTPAVLAVFQSLGWGWGGSWYGTTKDYMHFSTNGH